MSHEIISDDEPIYRRVSLDFCRDGRLHNNTFKAHVSRDSDGISVSRGQSDLHPDFLTPKQLAANGPSKLGYYVAELSAAELIRNGIQIQFSPTEIDPGHCLLSQLRSDNRDEIESIEIRDLLVRLNPLIHGPFPGTPRAE